jgi:hypothetical protein
MRQKSQQHIDQQGRVDLPSDRVGVVTKEAAKFEALLALFEEHEE